MLPEDDRMIETCRSVSSRLNVCRLRVLIFINPNDQNFRL